MPDEVIAAVVLLRERLTTEDLDAGPLILQTHLAHQGLAVPSTATIRRILHQHGLITRAPRKRPKSSYHRFAAEQPNECWQSDFTHWTLADGTEAEILNWLDDHSRYLLTATAYRRVTGPDVVASFTAPAAIYGLPASTLTDNAAVYTSRFTHGHNDFELPLATLGITQKNGRPNHPQTQGKDLPSNRYAQIAVRVQALCDTYDLPYSTGSLVRQYLLTLRTINKLALPDAVLVATCDDAPETASERKFYTGATSAVASSGATVWLRTALRVHGRRLRR